MKRVFFTLIFFGAIIVNGYSQKFGYVDMEFIMNKVPAYQEAQKEINELSLSWQDEIQDKHKEIEAMYSALKAEEILLTQEMKAERQKEIKRNENDLKQYQKKIFGFDGLFFLKKKELIKPVQDEVFDAVAKVSKQMRLQIVFDKSGELVMIYTDPIHDYTDHVLEELGLGDDNDVIK